MKTILSIIALWLTAAISLFAQAPWGANMQRGIAAVSCGAPSEDASGMAIPANLAPTFGLFDLRNPGATDYGPCGISSPLWFAPQYHHSSWNARDLGNVFGIALDENNNIYVTAHGLYGAYRPLHHRYGNIGGGATNLNAAGTVYKIDNATGAVSVFCVIPGQQTMVLSSNFSSGPGLGNITYDYDHQLFFVTSLEDGRIYRIDSSGSILNFHDPMTADSGAVGMPPRNERLWAVEYENGELYYSIWNDGSVANPSEIRKVGLNTSSGNFMPTTDVHVINAPGQASPYSTSPVSDISFSLDGQTMAVGARTMADDTTAYNHRSGSYLMALVSGTWTPTHFQRTGCNIPDGEGYGGIAFGEESGTQDSVLWNSSADMAYGYGPHGLYGVRISDVPVSGQAPLSWKVPYLPTFSYTWTEDWKGSGGDIEIVREREDCARVVVEQINCPELPGDPYTVDLILSHNVTTTSVDYLLFKPCPTASLPVGAITGQPQPSGLTFSPSLSPATSYPITVSLPSAPLLGGKYCFTIKLLDTTGAECCLEKVCIDLPPCDCAELLDSSVDCEPDSTTGLNKYTLNLTVRNRTNLSPTPFAFTGGTFLPLAGFDQSSISLSPSSIPPGGIGTVSVCYYGTPGTLCFNMALHDITEEYCCSVINICLELPPCDGIDPEPDTCGLETKVPCCPETGIAMLNFTVCNNSLAPRTYTWNATTNPNVTCPIVLDPSDFSPPSGTLGPIPPSGCMTVTIAVRCEKLQGNRPCANVLICADAGIGTPLLCCQSIVYQTDSDEIIIKHSGPAGDPIGDPLTTGPGDIRQVYFKLENPTDAALPVTLTFNDETGTVMPLDNEGRATFLHSIELSLPANGTEIISQEIARIDNGQLSGWTSLQVFGSDPFDPLLIIPVHLAGVNTEKTLPKIKKIETISLPEATVELEIETMPGRFYQIQQSNDLSSEWLNTDCTVTTGGYANGTFLGSGKIIKCTVPCEELDANMFYRVLRLD